jgi:hypothetical protein
MRLRINRIALVQELRVEYILGYLKECGVINEEDQRKIDMGTTPLLKKSLYKCHGI